MFGNFARWNEPSRGDGTLLAEASSSSKNVDYKVVNTNPRAPTSQMISSKDMPSAQESKLHIQVKNLFPTPSIRKLCKGNCDFGCFCLRETLYFLFSKLRRQGFGLFVSFVSRAISKYLVCSRSRMLHMQLLLLVLRASFTTSSFCALRSG